MSISQKQLIPDSHEEQANREGNNEPVNSNLQGASQARVSSKVDQGSPFDCLPPSNLTVNNQPSDSVLQQYMSESSQKSQNFTQLLISGLKHLQKKREHLFLKLKEATD